MKVSGPDSGAGAVPPDGATEAGGAEGHSPVGAAGAGEAGATEAAGVQPTEGSGRAFAETLAATAPGGVGSTDATTPATAHAGGRATAAIAAELDAGRLTPAAAIDRVVEQVLTRQLGSDAPPAVRERVRAALQEALETDPLLAEKLRRLES